MPSKLARQAAPHVSTWLPQMTASGRWIWAGLYIDVGLAGHFGSSPMAISTSRPTRHPPPWCCNTFSNNLYLHTASVSVPACGTRRLARDSVVSPESCAFPGVAQGIRNVKSSTQHQRQTEMEEELGRVIPRGPLALGNKSLRCSQCRRTR